MTVLIGVVIAAMSILLGYILEHGNLSILIQPVEVLIIFGTLTGTFIIMAPVEVIKDTMRRLAALFKAKGGESYMELIALLNDLFAKITREGILSVESDILAKRAASPFFAKYPAFVQNERAVKFLCDSLAIIVDSDISADALETLMETEIETYTGESNEPVHFVEKLADSLPGLGIVACVLGVVLTMGKIDQPPAVLGESIAVALLGTFMGILACYGFLGPMATAMGVRVKKDIVYFQIIKVALTAFMKGTPGRMAVEFAKRVVPSHDLGAHSPK